MSSGGGGGPPGWGLVEKIMHNSHESGGYHMSVKEPVIIMGVLLFVFFIFAPGQTLRNFNLLIFLAPIWAPVMLVYFSFSRFLQSRRAAFIASQPTILLELKLPRDTKKTPLAMETVLTNLNFSSGETTWYKKYWKGGVRPWWTFEIASIGGQVRFYIWTRTGLRRGLESFFYAQYPGIEIIEAEDYSRIFDASNPNINEMWGCEYLLTKPDPFPIKTYIEFGLDKPGMKPEEQVDPLAQLIELLGSIGPNEQLWYQIIFRQSRTEKYGKGKTWKDESKEIIEGIRKDSISRRTTVDPTTGAVKETEGFPNPTGGQKATIEALERNTGKPGFDVGMRAIYMAKKGHIQPAMITYLINMLKPFHSEGWNGFKLSSLFSAKFNDYPWEDRHGHHKQHEHEKLVEYYRRRSYFHDPYVGPWMILSSEELATIFHVPSGSVETPSLPRIQSATSGAPANLPT
ncbi:MAG TPA: hypothetical protein VGB97_01545 [Candidatus Paceibacterota bacterium]